MFAGIPGTGVRSHVRAIADELRRRGRTVDVRSIDELLWQTYHPGSPHEGPSGNCHRTDYHKIDYDQILSRPRGEVRERWANAVKSLAREVASSGADYLLVDFHAVYHSDRYRYRFSPVSVEAVQLLAPMRIVCVVDDIFDGFRSLREQWRFAFDGAEGSDGVRDAIFTQAEHVVRELCLMVQWRQEEILAADLLTANLTGPEGVRPTFSVRAKKHGCRWNADLLDATAEVVYCSHPISLLRREASFPNHEVRESIDSAISFAANHHPVIAPTTIDELRFRSHDEAVLPHLTSRWPLMDGEAGTVIESILDQADLLPAVNELLRNRGASELDLPALAREFDAIGDDIARRLQPLLVALRERLHEDIQWRDFFLVGEASSLLVLRPYALGKFSAGVMREVEAKRRGAAPTAVTPLVRVWSPRSDLELLLKAEHPRNATAAGALGWTWTESATDLLLEAVLSSVEERLSAEAFAERAATLLLAHPTALTRRHPSSPGVTPGVFAGGGSSSRRLESQEASRKTVAWLVLAQCSYLLPILMGPEVRVSTRSSFAEAWTEFAVGAMPRR